MKFTVEYNPGFFNDIAQAILFSAFFCNTHVTYCKSMIGL